MSIEEILALPDVVERVELYQEQADLHAAQLRRCTRLEGEVAILDLREEEVIHAGNRFMIYALFPEATVSIHVMWGRAQQNTVLAVGKSILDRSNDVSIGELMLAHGGGGHRNAGTCQVEHDDAEAVLAEVVSALNGAPVPA